MTSYNRREARWKRAKRHSLCHNTRCTYCQRPLKHRHSECPLAFTNDHLVPLSRGGTKTVPACKTCNHIKGDMMPADWRRYQRENPGWWRKHKQKDNRNG